MRLLFALVLALPLGRATAQPDARVGIQTVWIVGARATGMGGAGVALDGAGWVSLNPALLAPLGGPQVRLYADQGFGLPELRTGAVQFASPLRGAAFSVGAQTLGFEAFRVSNFTVGAARPFALGTNRQLRAGVVVALHHAHIQHYGSGLGVTLDAGMQVEVMPGLHLGFSGRNVSAAQLAGVEPLPQVLAVGLALAPDARVRIAADAVKDTRFPASLRTGVEVALHPAITVRVGAATTPTLFSAGTGLHLGRLTADLAATRHAVLGWTPAVELGLAW